MSNENANMAQRYEREIPEGYEARIEGNKVIFELKESEDERIRKWLADYFKAVGKSWIHRDISPEQILAYLEKQKEQRAVLPGDEDDEDILSDPVFLKGFDLGREVQKIFDEPKQEWSEEDEKNLQRAIQQMNLLEEYIDDGSFLTAVAKESSKEVCRSVRDWLKRIEELNARKEETK